MIRILTKETYGSLGDVYVSDWLAGVMVNDPELGENVLQRIEQFKRDDYGLVCGFDRNENETNRWMFGGDLLGRYSVGTWHKAVEIGGQKMKINMSELYIKIRTYEGSTYVLTDSEWDWLIREEEKAD